MIKAAEKASKSIIRDFGEVEKLQVSKKGPYDFVTKTDKQVEKVLIEELSKIKKNYSLSLSFKITSTKEALIIPVGIATTPIPTNEIIPANILPKSVIGTTSP